MSSASAPLARPRHHALTFPLACWVLGLVAFVELLAAGFGLAVRLDRTRQVRIVERSVPEIVAVAVPSPTKPDPLPPTEPRGAVPPPASTNTADPPVAANPPPTAAPLPPASPLATPPIADPTVERLVAEAREARVAEDLRKALVKLDEAKSKAPDDPNVLYESALVYELMGVFDLASAHYQKVFELGTSGAGSLYQAAAIKLRDGFEQPQDKRGRLSLGRVRIFKDQRVTDGQRVVLTVPLQAVPGEQINPSDLEVVVRFFDEVANGDPQPAAENSRTSYDWVTLPLDWQNGEELLQVTYFIPAQDTQQEHLFGKRHYYGQIVELVYRGKLLDSQAWPGLLARKLDTQVRDPLFLDPGSLPPGFNPDNPLLPLPEH